MRHLSVRSLRDTIVLGFLATAFLVFGAPQPANAEGSYQAGLNQPLYEYNGVGPLLLSVNHPFYVNILSAGEVINVNVCGAVNADDLTVEIYNPSSSQVFTQSVTASNVDCADTFAAPLTGGFEYTTLTTGVYEVRVYNDSNNPGLLNRLDITVTANSGIDPNPTTAGGRLFTYDAAFSTGSFAEAASTDANYFILTPGGFTGTNYTWKLDLNKFSGFVYEIIANDIGVNSPNSGLSVNQTGNSMTPKFPIYFSYPAIALPEPGSNPALGSYSFLDSDGVDNSISPADSIGIQDTGTFSFTSDAVATYSIVIDTNNDSVYTSGDTLLLGSTVVGQNNVVWNGKDNSNVNLPAATYNARLQIRLGEYHFVAADAETSGGTFDGLTIFRMSNSSTAVDTQVYWDDATILGGTSTLPTGQASSLTAGHHTWGDFTSGGFGNARFIDTYVYGNTTSSIIPVVITPAAGDLLPNLSTSTLTDNDADNIVLNNQVVTYTLTIKNTGNTSATATATHTLHTNHDAFTVTNIGGTCGTPTNSSTSAGFNITGLTIAVGVDCVITYTANVKSSLADGATMLETVTVAAPGPDGTPSAHTLTVQRDTDGDGHYDSVDDIDDDNDGVLDTAEGGTDFDGDGKINRLDLDSDHDGISDIIEAGGVDVNGDGKADGYTDLNNNGWDDTIEASPFTPPNTDGTGGVNYLDIDSDDDGIVDNIEAQTTPGYLAPLGIDTDGDGIDNRYDPNNGGTALIPVDTDGDTIRDYRDTDTDGDGVIDLIEGDDANFNGVADHVFAVADTDADGLMNVYDTVVGPAFATNSTGSNVPLQDTDTDGAKDWRDNNDDADYLSTSAEDINTNLNWADDFSQGGSPRPNYLFFVQQPSGSSIGTPSATSVSINNDAACTPTRNVSLTLRANDATEVQVSESSILSGANWQSFTSPSTNLAWVFAGTTGTKTIYALFRNGGIKQSNVVSDSITLDVANQCGIPPAQPQPDTPPPGGPPPSTPPPTTTPPTTPPLPVIPGPMCKADCANVSYDVYIVNPDGTERHMNDPKFARLETQGGIAGLAPLANISFEDKGNDMDYNDVIVKVDRTDCTKISLTSLSVDANWRHNVRMTIIYKNRPIRDLLIWRDSHEGIGTFGKVNANEGDTICEGKPLALEITLPTDTTYEDPRTGQVIKRPRAGSSLFNSTALATSACSITKRFTDFLTFGNSGPEVLRLQTVLGCLGHFPASVIANGNFGPATRSAVVAFQTAKSIDPFGWVGPFTRAALNLLVK